MLPGVGVRHDRRVAGVLSQQRRPPGKRCTGRRQRHLLPSAVLGPSDVEVLQQNSPGHSVDGQMMNNQRQLAGVSREWDSRLSRIKQDRAPKVTNPKAAGYNAAANQQYQMWKTYNDLQVQMQKAAAARTPKEAMQAQQRINQDMSRLQQQYYIGLAGPRRSLHHYRLVELINRTIHALQPMHDRYGSHRPDTIITVISPAAGKTSHQR